MVEDSKSTSTFRKQYIYKPISKLGYINSQVLTMSTLDISFDLKFYFNYISNIYIDNISCIKSLLDSGSFQIFQSGMH